MAKASVVRRDVARAGVYSGLLEFDSTLFQRTFLKFL
jgi:hypothetical protein